MRKMTSTTIKMRGIRRMGNLRIIETRRGNEKVQGEENDEDADENDKRNKRKFDASVVKRLETLKLLRGEDEEV